jgi:PIN domain nuclease of toxin-antitoxin system
VAGVLIDTHVLLWVLDGSLPRRSSAAAKRVAEALDGHAVHVSIGSFLDLRYLADGGRLSPELLAEVERVVTEARLGLLAVDFEVYEAMAQVSREQVADPFDRIIAATAIAADLPLVTADERVRAALNERAVW